MQAVETGVHEGINADYADKLAVRDDDLVSQSSAALLRAIYCDLRKLQGIAAESASGALSLLPTRKGGQWHIQLTAVIILG